MWLCSVCRILFILNIVGSVLISMVILIWLCGRLSMFLMCDSVVFYSVVFFMFCSLGR